MRAISKRTASFSVAIAVFALIGAGCHQSNNSSSSSSAASSSASAMTSSAAAEPSTSAAAPTSTQIAGKNGTEYTVQGPILAKWDTLTDEQKKDLGAPFGEQKNTGDNSGVYQQFDDGVARQGAENFVPEEQLVVAGRNRFDARFAIRTAACRPRRVGHDDLVVQHHCGGWRGLHVSCSFARWNQDRFCRKRVGYHRSFPRPGPADWERRGHESAKRHITANHHHWQLCHGGSHCWNCDGPHSDACVGDGQRHAVFPVH